MAFKGFGEKLNALKDKVSDAVADAKLGEKFDQAKQNLTESMDKMKEEHAKNKALSDEAKAPIEGALIRYQVIYLGGFPTKPQKKTDSLSIGFNIMNDSFIFKPELYTKSWFGEENLIIKYDSVTKFEVVKRQVSTAEALMGSGDTKSLEQLNNIEITYTGDDGIEHVVRVEMLTGTTVYGQATKCREMLDLLRENQILNKLNKSSSENKGSGENDILAQLEKLSSLKEKGIISEEEFNEKKSVLLSKL